MMYSQCLKSSDCPSDNPVCLQETKTCGKVGTICHCFYLDSILKFYHTNLFLHWNNTVASKSNLQCESSFDCPNQLPVCDQSDAQCVQCLESANCVGSNSVCLVNDVFSRATVVAPNTCVRCTRSDLCNGQVCSLSGQFAFSCVQVCFDICHKCVFCFQ